MKRLLLLIGVMVILSIVTSYGQGKIMYDFDRTRTVVIDTIQMDNDTIIKLSMFAKYYWNIDGQYTGLDATDAYIKIFDAMKEDTMWHTAYNVDSTALNDATGTGIGSIADPWQGTTKRYLFIYVYSGSCSTGKLVIEGTLTRKD